MDRSKLQNLDTLLRYLADVISLKLKTSESPDRYWATALGPTDKLSEFLESEVLAQAAAPFVLALDEVDRVFDHPEYYVEFFGLMRSWHNKRAFEEAWNNLNLVLAYSTESSLMIPDQNQSPFNVGEPLESIDFTKAQVTELNHRHGSPLAAAAEIEELMTLLSGHPYLVRRALFELVKSGRTFQDLSLCAANDDGPFADHLQRYVVSLAKIPRLKAALKSVVHNGVCDTDVDFYDLRAAGLVRGHSRQSVEPRCGLYQTYFRVRL